MPANPKDPYAQITEQILALLNRGVVPWRKPWSGGWPRNLFSNRSYGLFNAMFLNVAGFGSPFWATQHQIEKRQGSIREDQVKKPASVFVTLPPRRYLVNAGEFGRIPRIGGLLRFHEIWNVEQTTGLERFIPKPKQTVPVDEAKKVVQEMPKPVFLRRNPGQAYYVPSRDFISIPSESQFTSLEAYYATLFHELVHATGHPCRLKRKALDEWTSLGDHAYSQEELVAEFGAAMLCGLTGLAPLTIQNSAAYVQSWLKALGNDKTLLVMAAGQAQKACDFIRAIEKRLKKK